MKENDNLIAVKDFLSFWGDPPCIYNKLYQIQALTIWRVTGVTWGPTAYARTLAAFGTYWLNHKSSRVRSRSSGRRRSSGSGGRRRSSGSGSGRVRSGARRRCSRRRRHEFLRTFY